MQDNQTFRVFIWLNLMMLFKYDDFVMEYETFGKGDKVIIAFHGFSRNANDFRIYDSLFESEYRFFSFNLFHHQNSTYPKDRIDQNTLKKEEFKAMFEVFLDEKGIQNFSLMGFSMGGKIVLTLFEFFPNRVNQLILLAPDGLKKNYAYSFLSKTEFGNWLYRRMLKNPQPFLNFISFLGRLKLIDSKTKKFVLQHISTPEMRLLVYHVWMSYRNIVPDLVCVRNKLLELKTPIELFFGKYDSVIPVRLGEHFMKGIENENRKIHVLDAGHLLMKPEITEQIIALWHE